MLMQPNTPESSQMPNGSVPALGPNPYASMTPAPTPKPKGHIPVLPIVSGLLVFLLICVSALAGWAIMERQDYKNNVDKKVAAGVEAQKQAISTAKDKELAEKEKLPLKTYTGPESYGSLKISYPKTWSGYVAPANGTAALDAYFHPDVVPGVGSTAAYALHVQVLTTTYSKSVQQYAALTKANKVKSSPFSLAKQPKETGTKIEGQIATNQQGVVVLIPLRDKTIKISTENPQYLNDFNTNILPNIDFQP